MGRTLLILGLLGPMLCGIVFTYMTRGAEGRREYWNRVFDPRRIGAGWHIVILTWIFNNTRRSTLGAILFHLMANLSYTLGNVTPGTNLYSTILLIISAMVVACLWSAGLLDERRNAHSSDAFKT